MRNNIFVLMFLTLSILVYSANLYADDDAMMDRDDPEYTAVTGEWTASTWAPCAVGGGYHYARGDNDSLILDTAQNADISGYYMVYARWTSHANRNNNARYDIYDGTILRTWRYVDQRSRSCEWNYLATVYLTVGNRGRVKVSNPGALNSEYTVADGIRFVRTQHDRNDIIDEAGSDFASGANVSLTSSNKTVETVIITAPISGRVIVNASGYFNFTTSGADTGRCSITTGTTVDFAHLIIGEDDGGSVMSFMPFAGTRGFSVGAGSTTFRLVCNRYAGGISIGDPHMTAIFTSTGY